MLVQVAVGPHYDEVTSHDLNDGRVPRLAPERYLARAKRRAEHLVSDVPPSDGAARAHRVSLPAVTCEDPRNSNVWLMESARAVG